MAILNRASVSNQLCLSKNFAPYNQTTFYDYLVRCEETISNKSQ